MKYLIGAAGAVAAYLIFCLLRALRMLWNQAEEMDRRYFKKTYGRNKEPETRRTDQDHR